MQLCIFVMSTAVSRVSSGQLATKLLEGPGTAMPRRPSTGFAVSTFTQKPLSMTTGRPVAAPAKTPEKLADTAPLLYKMDDTPTLRYVVPGSCCFANPMAVRHNLTSCRVEWEGSAYECTALWCARFEHCIAAVHQLAVTSLCRCCMFFPWAQFFAGPFSPTTSSGVSVAYSTGGRSLMSRGGMTADSGLSTNSRTTIRSKATATSASFPAIHNKSGLRVEPTGFWQVRSRTVCHPFGGGFVDNRNESRSHALDGLH